MIFFSWVVIDVLAALCAVATIQQPRLRRNETTPSTPSHLALTSSDGNLNLGYGDTGRDPKYFSLFYDMGEDLSDKSTYLNVLKALRDFAKLPFTGHFHGGFWSIPGYEDVMVAIDPDERLQVNYAMWALEDTISHMIIFNFDSCRTHMYYNYGRGRGPVKVGLIQISKPTARTISTETNSTTALESSAVDTTSLDDDDVSISNNSVTSLGARNWEVREHLNGARLSKAVVFTLIYGAIIRMAELPRSSFPLRRAATIPHEGWELTFQAWDPRARDFGYEQLQWMLNQIPKGMYSNNKFQAGEVVMVVDDQYVGKAGFSRMRTTGSAVVEQKQ